MRAGRIGDWAAMMGVGFSCRRCIRRGGTLFDYVCNWMVTESFKELYLLSGL